jgi:hypothetical protein
VNINKPIWTLTGENDDMQDPHLGQGPMRFIPAPYFCLARGLFIPCAIAWDSVSGLFQRLEGPDGFTTWDKAEEASPCLAHSIE